MRVYGCVEMISPGRRDVLVERLYRGVDPFVFYVPNEEAVDFQGWNSGHDFLSESIAALRPSTVIEIGVWKGGSLMTMASAAKRLGIDSAFIAVDTWRGSSEHWLNEDCYPSLKVRGGISRLQETFMTNIMAKGLQSYVVPLPLDSVNAYQVCLKQGISPDLIHIDAGHDFESVSLDLKLWSSILADNGAIIMDDYLKDGCGKPVGFVEVAKATDEFIRNNQDRVYNFKAGLGKCIFSLRRLS